MLSTVFFDNSLAQTSPFPLGLNIIRAEGIYLYDVSGKVFIDFISGVGVSNLGHGHPKIVQAIKDQAGKHLHVMVYGEFLQQPQVRAAKLLTDTLPATLDTCYFVNSGTEANEAALKLAKRATGRTKIVSCIGAYHGSTHGSLSVSGNELKKSAFRPLLPDVHFMRFGSEEDLKMIDDCTACVIIETIQGDAGVRIPSVQYMKALRKRCDETNTMLILDEVQCGMGRTGTMWAFEQMEIVPDILATGKALAGGLPVGCMVASRKLMETFTHDPALGHITTFGGHPLICASIAATLEVYRDEKVLEDVKEKGLRIFNALKNYPAIKEIRYRGLFFAIDLESEDIVNRVVEKCLDRGLIAFWFLSCPASFRIAPPLVCTQQEIDKALEIIVDALNDATQ
ncbi:MAG: aspartate aminotransferase family protein [Flavobacteriales bacterium]|nr:aspartate aminotransferase family protein [Flavobacteriales bacterium]